MEILITTILIIAYLLFKDFSHQRQVMKILNVLVQGKEEIPVTLNPFKRILKKDFEKNSKTESDMTEGPEEYKYLPLEDVPEDEIRNAFEGTKKVDNEEVE